MRPDEIEQVMALMQRHGIAAFEFERGRTHIQLSRHTGASLPADTGSPSTSAAGSVDVLRSPGVGRLRLTQGISGTPAASLPRRVKKDEIVAYLAVGPVLRPVLAARDCTLRALLSQEGALTGYGDPLFSL